MRLRRPTGARWQQKLGDIWDQFDVTYEWANGPIAVLKTRYQDGCLQRPERCYHRDERPLRIQRLPPR